MLVREKEEYESEVFVNLWHGSNHCYPKAKLQNFYHNNKCEDLWVRTLSFLCQYLLNWWCVILTVNGNQKYSDGLIIFIKSKPMG